MKLLLKILGGLVAAVILLIVAGVVAINSAARKRIARKHPIPAITAVAIPTDSVALARGEHLAHAVLNCVECHDSDLGGKVYLDAGPLGVIIAPNITPGRGSVTSGFAVTDWMRAIRYGIRSDSTSLMVMPSETFTHMTDADLGALIAYLQQLPAVDRENERTKLRTLGNFMLVSNAIPIMSAELTSQHERPMIVPGVSIEYGGYLAQVSGCKGCHGDNFAGGGEIGPPGSPLPANLTAGGSTAQWSEAQFMTALREGRRPDGTMINEFMPWKTLGRMTDEELRAIWMFLRSLPPVETPAAAGGGQTN